MSSRSPNSNRSRQLYDQQEYGQRERPSSLLQAVGDLTETVAYSASRGARRGHSDNFKLTVIFGVMAFIIGVLLMIVYYNEYPPSQNLPANIERKDDGLRPPE